MNAREHAMAAHPAGKGIPRIPDRIQALIDAAQDEQALELANRERSDLEAWGMAPMRRINEKHHDWSARNRWADWLVPAALVIGLYLLVVGAAVAGEMVGGWHA